MTLARVVAITCLVAALLTLPAGVARPAGTDCPPVLNGNGTVTFRYCQAATSVTVVGEWADPIGTSSAAMTKDPVTDVWSATVTLRNHLYSYTYTVNGSAGKTDPSNPPWDDTGLQSQFFIPGPNSPATPAENYDWLNPSKPGVQHGTLHRYFLATPYSTGPFANGNHPIAIYTPPGYETSTRRYPTLYISHGGGGNDVDWSTQGYASYIEDNLIAAGEAEPMVIVMTNFNNTGRDPDTTREEDGYREDVLAAYIPWVESHFRVYTGRWSRIFAGLSQGGAYGQNIIERSSDAFSYFGIWSPACIDVVHPDCGRSPTLGELQPPDPQTLLGVHLGSGDNDFFGAEATVATEEANLTGAGIAHRRHMTPQDVMPMVPVADWPRLTEHTWDVWREELRDALQNTFLKVKTATTTAVDSNYGVLSSVGGPLTITAQVTAANRHIGDPDVGTVEFTYGGDTHTSPVGTTGLASWTTTLQPGGSPHLTAHYVPAPGSPFLASTSGVATGACTVAPAPAWMDTSKTPQERAELLVAAMTKDQKVSLLSQDQWLTHFGAAGYIAGISALCIPDLVFSDSGQGVGGAAVNTTAFAAPILQASTWDPVMQYGWGSHVGWEAWNKGIDIQLAPAFNLARFPRNGRNFEYMGEDPFLAGKGAAASARGLQSQHVVATLKHYAANNHESNRNSVSSDVDPRTMHELYLAAFETAVKESHAGSVMCSYNRLNFVAPYANADSIYACEHPTLLNTYLKGEFGFDGWVMSDWGATHTTVAAANAGLDQEMNILPGSFFAQPLSDAVTAGTVTQARLDDMVTRILRAFFRVGVFDYPPAAQPGAEAANVETADELLFARKLAEQGTVLLKNQGGLPLAGASKKIAVIGRAAGPDGVLDIYNGGGSAHIPQFGNKADVVSPLEGIQQRAALATDTVVYSDGSNTTEAADLAAQSDVAIVFGYYTEAEGSDRASLSLDSSGDALITAVAAAQPNTIVVLNTGGPALMPWLANVKAVLEAWYPGQEYGHAIANLLFGDVNPSGKLPQTFPKSEADLPTAGHPERYPGVTVSGIPHAAYSEGLQIGYRWFEAQGIEPLFCFGHGLSYTTFGYSGLTVTPGPGTSATVTFTLTNTGSRLGSEVAQVYVADPPAAGEPSTQLKGFQKVTLAAGESKQVTIALNSRAFSYWKDTATGWTVAPGTYTISVGSSSCDTSLQGDVSFSPTAVMLRSFTAKRTGTSVSLRWRTGTETGLLGFQLYRGPLRIGPVVRARGSAAGGSYVHVDRLRQGNRPLRYRLQAVRVDGSRVWLGAAAPR